MQIAAEAPDHSPTTATTSPPAAPRAALVWIGLAVIYIVWGSTYLGIKVAIETVPPFLMAAARFAIAGGLLYVWAIRRGDRVGDRPRAPQWRAAFVVGGLLLVGGNGAVTWAEQRIDSGIAALLVATVPLWMALFGWLREGERLSGAAVLGLGLGFLGVAVLVQPSGAAAVDVVGALVVVAGACSWGWGSVQSRRANLPARPLVATSMQMLAAAALFVVLGVARGELAMIDLGAVTVSSALAVVYLALFGSVLAFSAYVWLLRVTRTSLVATYAYVNPVVAVLLGWGFLGEAVTVRTLAAGAIILAGVVLIITAKARHVVTAQPDAGSHPQPSMGSHPQSGIGSQPQPQPQPVVACEA